MLPIPDEVLDRLQRGTPAVEGDSVALDLARQRLEDLGLFTPR